MKTLCAAVLLAVAASAYAGPTGLNCIPTASILKHKEIVIGYCLSGTERNVDKRYSHVNSLTLGLFDRLEVGVDNDFAGWTAFNAKVLLLEDDARAPGLGLSAGVCGVSGRDSEPYVAASYDAKVVRAHAGWWRTAGASRAFVGLDVTVFGEGIAMLEHIAGPNGYTWGGVSAPVQALPGLWWTVGVGYPNARADGVQHYGMLEYCFRL